MSRIAGLFTALVILGGSASAPASADAPDPPGTLTFGGLQRNYVLHVPPGPPAGLVINLHGAGMSGQDQAAVTGYDAVGDRYGFVVAYPNSIDARSADVRVASARVRIEKLDVWTDVESVGVEIERDLAEPGHAVAQGREREHAAGRRHRRNRHLR